MDSKLSGTSGIPIYSHLHLLAVQYQSESQARADGCFCRATATNCGVPRCSQASCEVHSLHCIFGQPWGSFTGGHAHYTSGGRYTYYLMTVPPQVGPLQMEEEMAQFYSPPGFQSSLPYFSKQPLVPLGSQTCTQRYIMNIKIAFPGSRKVLQIKNKQQLTLFAV